MKWIRWIALLAGISMFAVSFMLPAISQASSAPGSPGIPGYKCAFLSLVVTAEEGGTLIRQAPLEYISVLISGWINPVFLVSLLLLLIKPRWRSTIALRYVVTVMFVFCWIAFYQIHLYPQQGYFLWMFGILLALYSNMLSNPDLRKQV
ncbi:MAG TPA: hypothetical protein VFY05_14625 [Candidatus Angelobacter sp.]|nr:hypothetical protein [Candidatus Angelobacter sp.]